MSITLIQKSADAALNSASSFAVTLSNTAAGNAIVVIVCGNGMTGLSISDTINTYSSTSVFSNGSDQVAFFYVLNGAGNSGTLTITVSQTSTSDIYANAREYHSTLGVMSFDGSVGTATPGNTATPTSDSLTTTGSSDVLVAGMTDFNAVSGTAGTGWGNQGVNTNQGGLVTVQEDQLNKAAASYQAVFNLGSAQSDWIAAFMALKEASAAAGVNPAVGMRSFLSGGHR